MLIGFAYAFAMGYSRIVIGVHSWYQVIYGWLVGIWVAATLHILLKDTMFLHVKKINDNQYQKSEVKKFMWQSSALFAVGFLIQIVIYLILKSVDVENSEWISNINSRDCEYNSEKWFL